MIVLGPAPVDVRFMVRVSTLMTRFRPVVVRILGKPLTEVMLHTQINYPGSTARQMINLSERSSTKVLVRSAVQVGLPV